MRVVVPGAIDQSTGGFIYDGRMAKGLKELGWRVTVHELEGRFPDVDTQAASSLRYTLEALPNGERVVLDGLAIGAVPDLVAQHARRLRLVALVHHPLADETGLDVEVQARFARLEQRALAACRGIIVTSPFTATRLETYGVVPARIRIVPPGVDRAPLAQGVPDGTAPRLLCVGSVTPRKGQDVLVGALERIREVAWQCVCAGSLMRAPKYVQTLRQRVADIGLVDRFEFVGECDRPRLDALYDRSTLFVLPSFFEGYGMALTEALVRGLPIISTTGGAIPFTVPADAGVLVSPGDEVALSEAISSVLKNSSTRRRFGVFARQYAKALPSWEAAIRMFGGAVETFTEEEERTGSQ